LISEQDNRKVTLLVQNLCRLVKLAQSNNRYPALEMLLSRGRHFPTKAESADHFRFQLFGIEAKGELPVAALTRVTDGHSKPRCGQYWLRADPVTLWADVARIVMVSHGMAELDDFERNEIELTVRNVLREEGIQLHADHPERWCIALEEPPDSGFAPLEDALGLDLAAVMQDKPQSLQWRQITNEIQIALHACPVNIRRRQRGQREINSVWFWGGGFVPPASDRSVFDLVYSNNPVSCGLASINDCRVRTQSEVESPDFLQAGLSILIDWQFSQDQPEPELESLEGLVQSFGEQVGRGECELVFYDGYRHGWAFDRQASRKIWRRRKTLAEICKQDYPE